MMSRSEAVDREPRRPCLPGIDSWGLVRKYRGCTLLGRRPEVRELGKSMRPALESCLFLFYLSTGPPVIQIGWRPHGGHTARRWALSLPFFHPLPSPQIQFSWFPIAVGLGPQLIVGRNEESNRRPKSVHQFDFPSPVVYLSNHAFSLPPPDRRVLPSKPHQIPFQISGRPATPASSSTPNSNGQPTIITVTLSRNATKTRIAR